MTRTEIVTAGGLMLVILSACAWTGTADRGRVEGSEPALAGTAWTVEQLGDESGLALQKLTLTFMRTERINGHDGCNAFSGDVSVGDTSLHVGNKLIGTMMACPDTVEARARTYRAALMRATRYRIQDNTLQLSDSSGSVLVTLTPAEMTLAGSSWDAISYNNGKQAVVSVIVGTKITARFGEDGRITGHAGCNAYFAAYTVQGRGMTIQSPGSTRRACGEPAGVMEQEALYLQALSTATRYRISGNRLELRNAAGSLVAAFVRDGG